MAQPIIYDAVQQALQRRVQRQQMDQQASDADQNRAVQVLHMGQTAAMEPMRQESMLQKIKEQSAGAALREQIRGQYDVKQEGVRGDWQQSAADTRADAQRDVQAGRVNAQKYSSDSSYKAAIDKEQMGIDAGKYEDPDPAKRAYWNYHYKGKFADEHPGWAPSQRPYTTEEDRSLARALEDYRKAQQTPSGVQKTIAEGTGGERRRAGEFSEQEIAKNRANARAQAIGVIKNSLRSHDRKTPDEELDCRAAKMFVELFPE